MFHLFKWFKRNSKEFDKPKREAFKKRTKKWIFENQDFNVGKTYIELIFKDGRKFTTSVLGCADQPTLEVGCDESNFMTAVVEPRIIKQTSINDSKKVASDWLARIISYERTYVDHVDSPQASIIGQVVSAKIKKTVSHNITAQVVKIVDVIDNEESK